CHDRLFGFLASMVEEDTSFRLSEQFAEDRQFWLNYLADQAEVTSLGRIQAARPNGFLRTSARLPAADLARLNRAASRLQTRLSRVIVATAAIFVHRMTGAEDVLLSLPIGTRTPASRQIPGSAANVLPLRLMVRPSMSVADVVAEAAQQVRQVLKHPRFQTADIRRELGHVVGGPTFGPTVNFMGFNYDFSFSGSRAAAHMIATGPI